MAKGPFRGGPEPGLAALLRPKLGLQFIPAALPRPKLEPGFAPAGFPSVLRLRAAPRTPLAECCAAFVSMARRFRVSGLGLQSRRCGARTDSTPGTKPSDRGHAAQKRAHAICRMLHQLGFCGWPVRVSSNFLQAQIWGDLCTCVGSSQRCCECQAPVGTETCPMPSCRMVWHASSTGAGEVPALQKARAYHLSACASGK